jgi:UDP-glucose 4-epimerase
VQYKLNLGTGKGFSVREVIRACEQITGRRIPCRTVARRPGDPPALVADATQASAQLDWTPRYTSIEDIVETAWRWHQAHPNGYGSPP